MGLVKERMHYPTYHFCNIAILMEILRGGADCLSRILYPFVVSECSKSEVLTRALTKQFVLFSRLVRHHSALCITRFEGLRGSLLFDS